MAHWQSSSSRHLESYDTDDLMILVSQPLALKVESATPSDGKKVRKRRKRERNGDGVLKKRKLTEDQAAKLELSFDFDQKLETDRKKRLAAELGLEPRQVAVWFQNRRARFKCQKMEDEFVSLKSCYHNALAQKVQLETQVAMLKEKLEDAEQHLEMLSICERVVPKVTPNPTSSLLSVYDQDQAIDGETFLDEWPIQPELGNGCYILPEYYDNIPCTPWMYGLAI